LHTSLGYKTPDKTYELSKKNLKASA